MVTLLFTLTLFCCLQIAYIELKELYYKKVYCTCNTVLTTIYVKNLNTSSQKQQLEHEHRGAFPLLEQNCSQITASGCRYSIMTIITFSTVISLSLRSSVDLPLHRGLWVRKTRKARWLGHPGMIGKLHLTYYVLGHSKYFFWHRLSHMLKTRGRVKV